jgi:hypothetical protein
MPFENPYKQEKVVKFQASEEIYQPIHEFAT